MARLVLYFVPLGLFLAFWPYYCSYTIFCKLTYHLPLVISLISVRYNNQQFGYYSVFSFFAYLRYDNLILFVSTGKTVVLENG